MKKTFKTMLALMAGAMTFTGCTSDILENTPEQIPSALKPMTFTATQEGDATRAAIVGTAINWTASDKISIFDGATENNGNQEFTLTGEAGKPSGTFEGTAKEDAETYYALYPYASSSESRVPTEAEAKAAAGSGADQLDFWKERLASGDTRYIDQTIFEMEAAYGISAENRAIIQAYSTGGKISIKSGLQLNEGKIEGVAFPAAQTVGEGQSVDPKAMLMIGTSDDTNNIQFKNVCAYLKVTPTFACSSIVLKSNGTESLAGTVTVDYNEGNPTTTATNGTNTVTLSGTIAANSTYYIAVLPATLASGFTVEFKDASDKVLSSKSTTKDVTFARNKVINLGSFDALPTPPEGSVGTATRTGDVEVNWVQLWENGPKFAEYNVGATSVTEYGGYYAWGGSTNKGTDCNTGTSSLSGDDDTATNLWGSKWRMPTNAELTALLDNCICTWDDTNKGFLCTGKGDYAANSIFLPAAGYCYGDVSGKGDNGCYWSSTPSGSYNAYYLYYTDSQYVYDDSRYYGFSVRAVLKEAPATKGTAKATINSVETDVNWVQLWENGPKFAENNVADKMSFTDAAKTGADYVWGANWCTPSKEDMEHLMTAAKGGTDDKVKCEYTQEGSQYGFKFTGLTDGYTDNSVFFPAQDGSNSDSGYAYYWSATADDSKAWLMYLNCSDGDWSSTVWNSRKQDNTCLVRPVLAK